jgi:hypothetical protein
LDQAAIARYLQRIGWNIAKGSFWESDVEATYFEASKRTEP